MVLILAATHLIDGNVMPKFTPRQRKHKIQKGTRASENANIETAAAATSAPRPFSGKKQKRFEKYVEKKLKNEENLELLKKLAEAPRIDLGKLQSSRDFGRRTEAPRIRVEQDHENGHESYSSDDHSPASSIAEVSFKPQQPAFGSGLKRPLEARGGPLVIKKRRKQSFKAEPEEPSWEGFSSEVEEIEERSSDEESDVGSYVSSDESVTSSVAEDTRNRVSGFKAWASQQINESLGHTPTFDGAVQASPLAPSTEQDNNSPASIPKTYPKQKPPDEEPLPPELQIKQSTENRKTFSVKVDRSEDIERTRLSLPIVAEEQKIMEAIHNNPCVVVWGATGSGKTTQVPQFLFEAGYGNSKSPTPGMIGVTQPRRVAAVSMANRVGEELGNFANQVSYQIRFESTATAKTAIKFMTDGILLQEVAQDFALTKYSVIVIDEAHERSVNTDILIGMMSRIVDLRETMRREDGITKPLKLVIMSATLRIADFTENKKLFRNGPPPLVQAEGRQYPVTIHFARRTERDYVDELFRKVSRGHRKLPAGGILVFLTGQNEIKDLAKRLRGSFATTETSSSWTSKVQISARDVPVEVDDFDLGGNDTDIEDADDSDIEFPGVEGSKDEDEGFDIGESVDASTLIHILPLYSQLPTKEQLRVFQPAPAGSRMIVLATNVAETSLTIPGIRYVFDCGRSKERTYEPFSGIQSFDIGWISKASASQRAGRAGRTAPGHCYRVYSSAVYERDFLEHSAPEILRTPLEGVVLQMKTLGLDKVINFPFPTPPERHSLLKAEKLLKNLGALLQNGKVTGIGQSLSIYPLSPRFGKMLVIGNQHGCILYVIALVAALSVSDIFIPENQLELAKINQSEDLVYTNEDRLEDTARESRRKAYNQAHRRFGEYDSTSDALKLLSAVCAYAYDPEPEDFCKRNFLRSKALKEVTQLRHQLAGIVRANNPGWIGAFEAKLPRATAKQLEVLKQIVTAGFIDQVALRADLAPTPPDIPRKPTRAIDVPYLPLLPTSDRKGAELDKAAVYLHPSSVLSQTSAKNLPQYIVYSHLQRSANRAIGTAPAKVRMFPLTAASGPQLAALAHNTPLLGYGKPIGKIVQPGGQSNLRECWVIPSLVGESGSGGTGWPLPAKKVLQKRDGSGEWVIEKFLA